VGEPRIGDPTDLNATVVPSVSVIIELENILLSEQSRTEQLLRVLDRQVAESDSAVEIIFGFNPDQVSGTDAQRFLSGRLESACSTGRVSVHLCPLPGHHYYEIKNAAARLAHGDILLFLDSDVIPEPDWFIALTGTMHDHPDISVLTSQVYIDPDDIVGKAFALGWFFPLRSDKKDLEKNSGQMLVSSLAMRRKFFLANPFPGLPEGVTRGACRLLHRELLSRNIAIWHQPRAAVSHPAPNGFRHVTIRGLATGRDYLVNEVPGNSTGPKAFARIWDKTMSELRRARRNIRMNGHRVGLRRPGKAVALGIIGYFYLLALLGGGLSLAFPQRSRMWWHV